MKTIKYFALMLSLTAFALPASVSAFCGFNTGPIIPPSPVCACPANKIPIKRIVNDICQEELCVSNGAARHYLNQGWVNGCCSSTRLMGNGDNSGLSIAVFPNPAANALTISFNGSGEFLLGVYNAQGALMIRQALNSNTIDVSKLSPGLYVIELTSGTEVHRAKFVKE